MCDKFEPIYDTEIEICPNPSGENRDFHVYSFDADGDSSIVWHYCGVCAGYESACPERVTKEEIEEELIPTEFALHQNYPNPVNASTNVAYELPKAAHVKIEVFSVAWQHVTTILDAEEQAGVHVVEWNGTDKTGDQVASGVYLYRLTSDDFRTEKKMVLLK